MVKARPDSKNVAELAATYFTLGDSAKALPLAQFAWDHVKDPNIGINLALILKDLGRHEESFRVIEHAYQLNPDDFYIRLGYGEGMLKAGFWKQAWPIYDNARPTQQGAAMDLSIPHTCKEWNGEDISGKGKLLVINEGGTGDRISYARWLPTLTDMGIDWIFYPYSALQSFFERIFPPERLVKDGEQIIPDPVYWTTSFALPAKLGATPGTIPPPLKLTATPENIEKYKFTRTDKLPIVGICYEAAEMHQGGRKVRSLTEGEAMRLVCMTGDWAHWIRLKRGVKVPYPGGNIPFETWEDTVGLIHNLDGVVTVDTAIMHLAGAMVKPMAVPLS